MGCSVGGEISGKEREREWSWAEILLKDKLIRLQTQKHFHKLLFTAIEVFFVPMFKEKRWQKYQAYKRYHTRVRSKNKKGKLLNTLKEGRRQECVLLYWTGARMFCFDCSPTSSFVTHPLHLKQKFLIKMLQHLQGQRKVLEGWSSQPSTMKQSPQPCAPSPESLTFREWGTKEGTKLPRSSCKPSQRGWPWAELEGKGLDDLCLSIFSFTAPFLEPFSKIHIPHP